MQDHQQQDQTLERLSQDQLDALVTLHNRFLDGRLGGRRAMLKNTDISGLSLKGRDLRQSSFMGCVMAGMDLSKANFQEASLYACDLSNSNLDDTCFVRADLRGATIENASLEGADLEKADLRIGGIADQDMYDCGQAVNFRGANLSGAKLAGSIASRANFSDAILTGANMSKADLRGAQMEGADLSGAEIDGAQMEGANLKSAILTGVEMSKIRDKANIDLSEAITDENAGISIADLDEPLAQLIEEHRAWVETAGAKGTQLDLSNMDLRSLRTLKLEKMTAIRAVNTKFLGMNLYKIELQSAVLDGSDFRNCDAEEADFRGSSFIGANLSHSKMKNIEASPLMFGGEGSGKRFSPCNFENAKLRYADLSGARLKSAVFKGADLSYACLAGADLREADFTGANMTGVILDDAQTEGATIPKSDKPVFRLKAANKED
jgi:uncharacterized protein YjbI with pentapeptide repeats